MRTSLQALRTAQRKRGRLLLRRRLGVLPCRDRRDRILRAMMGTVALLLLAASLIAVRLADPQPELLRPLPDGRWKGNVRDDIAKRPYLAAAFHEDRLWVSQKGGRLHRYNPATELWSTIPLSDALPSAAEAVAFGHSCGRETLAAGRCPDAGLWLRGENGGLARLEDGRWSTVFSESAALGADGQPLNSSDLRTAALSDDKAWLLVGGDRGLGLLHRSARTWVPLPRQVYEALGSSGVYHLRFWRGSFWAAGREGLVRFEPEERPRPRRVPGIAGAVVDLEVESGPGEELWILHRPPCKEPSSQVCTAVSRLTSPGRPPETVLDESQRIESLDQGRIRYARQDGDRVTLAGPDGVITYGVARHRWNRLTDLPVRTVLPRPGGEILAGGRGGVARVGEGRLLAEWKTPGEDVRRLAVADNGRRLALTEREEILQLVDDGTTAPLFKVTATQLRPKSFDRAVAVGDHVLFLGSSGGMLHDVTRRTYRDLPPLPSWTKTAELRASQETVFGLDRRGSNVGLHALPLARLVQGDDHEVGRLRAPVEAADWDGQGLGLIDGLGQIYQATGSDLRALTGRALEDVGWDEVHDVALKPGRELLIATRKGLRAYLYGERGWDEPWRLSGLGGLRDVEVVGERVVARTGRLGVAWLGEGDPLLVGGQQESWPVLGELRDAAAHPSGLFLAAADGVLRYDPVRRRLGRGWGFEGRGSAQAPVRLLAILDEPLTLAREEVFVGSQRLDPDAGSVADAFLDGTLLWTVRRRGEVTYLKSYPAADPLRARPTRCLFRRPTIEADALLDAAEITPGWVAVAASSGLYGYHLEARSWQELRDASGRRLLSGGGRVHPMGSHLLLEPAGGGPKTLHLIATAELQPPPSCETAPVRLPQDAVETVPGVREVAVLTDRDNSRAVWLQDDGAIEEWVDGEIRSVAATSTDAPLTQDLRRVYLADQELLFAAADGVYSYQMRDHRWRRFPLRIPERGADLDVSTSTSPPMVTVRGVSGAVYAGGLGEELKEVFEPAAATGPGPLVPDRLLDVQKWGTSWLFLQADGLWSFDPRQRRWNDGVQWPRRDDVELRQASGLKVLRMGGDLWIERRGSLGGRLEQRFARYAPAGDVAFAVAADGGLWRLLPDGQVLRCRPEGAGYQACSIARSATQRLDPDRISQAYDLGTELWLLGDDGIRRIDLEFRRDHDSPLPEAVRNLGRIVRLQRAQGMLWLLAPSNRLFRRDLSEAWSVTRGVDRLVIDEPGDVWIEIAGRWSFWNGSGFEEMELEEPPEEGSAPPLADAWPTWRKRVVAMPDGGRYLDPVQDLVVTEEGLFASRPSHRELLAKERAAIGTDSRPPLDAGWLRWRREASRFEVRTPKGPAVFAPGRLVEGGRLIFEGLSAALAESTHRLHAANRHGILSFPALSCDLSQEEIVYRGEGLPGRLVAAHGRFLTPEKSVVAFNTATRFDEAFEDDRTYRVHPFGNERIVLRENVWLGRLGHRIDGGGAPALGARGFTWDARHDVAYSGRTLMVLSDAGFHPWNLRLATFADAPAELSASSAEMTTDRGELFLRVGATWQRRVRDGWEVSARLPGDGERLRGGDLIWERRGPWLRVFAEEPAHGFELHQGADGLGFTADRLRAATSHEGRFFLQSDAFLEIGGDLADLDGLAAERLGDVRAEDLFTLVPAPGARAVLYRRRGTDVDQWDGKSFSRVPDPRPRKRLLTRLGPLLLNVEGPRLVPELELLDPTTGQRLRRPFEVTAEGFPFDRVYGLGALGDDLFLQTLGGLQVVSAGSRQNALPLVSAVFYDVGRGDPNVVLGRPGKTPDRLHVRSGGACWSWRQGASGGPSRCDDPAALERDGRYEGEDGLWRWTRRGGDVEGLYKDGGGTRVALVSLRDGRFLHDRPEQLAACGGRAAALWRNGWLSFYPSLDLPLAGARHVSELASRAPRRLLCLRRPVPRDVGGTVAAGLYVELGTREILAVGQARFTAVTDPQDLATLRLQLDDPPVYLRRRLRLVRQGGQLVFEGRSGTSDWLPLPWQDGRLPIDEFKDFVARGRDVWVRTPAGFVGLELEGDALKLDPEAWTWVREPAEGSRLCRITDLEDLGRRVLVRCAADSSRLFWGELRPGVASGVFEPYPGSDIFAERTLIGEEDGAYWTWRLRNGGQSGGGSVEMKMRGHTVTLASGRFDFDDVRSLIVRPVDAAGRRQWDLATGGGWYRAAGEDLHLGNWRRPQGPGDPEEVRRVVWSLSRDGRPVPCVEGSDRAFRLTDDQRFDAFRSCREHLAEDGFWFYRTGGEKLEIHAAAKTGGVAERQLGEGRFADQVALGLPVASPDPERDGASLLVPTRAGVVGLGKSWYAASIHVRSEGLGKNRRSTALLADRDGRVLYLAGNGRGELRDLADGGLVKSIDTSEVPLKLHMDALETGPPGWLRLYWHGGGQAGSTLVAEDRPSVREPYADIVDMGPWSRFQEGRASWGNPGSSLPVQLKPRGGQLLHPEAPAHPIAWFGKLRPLASMPDGERLFVVEPRRLWEVRLDVAAREMFNRPR